MEQQRQQLTPEQDALEHIKAGRDKPFLEERFIDSFKGRGVFTHKAIEPSTFVVEYRGNISSNKNKRKCGDILNNYLFEFSWRGTQWCIDASKEDGTLGRLVNDNHISPNCEMKMIVFEGKPHLCLFAVEEISPGEEITFNYGDSSYPWRSKLEESSASSSSDDEELSDSGSSHSHDHFPDINTQLDLRDNLHFADFDYCHETTGTFMLQPENTASSSDELSWDRDHRPSKAAPNTKSLSKTNKNCCYVCGKAVVKIIRHLVRHADEEPDIAKALALPKTSKERKKSFAELRKRGNCQHATRVSDEMETEDNAENCDAEDDDDDEESDLPPQQSDAAEQQGGQLTPDQDALKHIKACRDKPFLEERFIDTYKGRGVFTRESIEPSTFVVEYRGRIVPHRQTRERKCGDSLNNYLFDFSWKGTKWRIDSTEEDGTLGRLVNDNHTSPNCEMKKVVYKGKPHLCLFAMTEISPGEEITFNYGDSSYPWRSKDEDCPSSCDEDNKPSTSNRKQSQKFTKFDPSKKQSFGQKPSSASRLEQDKADSSSNDDASDEESKDPSFTNKNYCFVCGCAQTKISRHLLTHRHEEPDIAALLRLRKNSKERKALLQKLRDRGNIQHNREVLKTRCGELKVRRRNNNVPITAKTFASCIYCKSMYVRKDMWRHVQRCSAKKLSEPHTDKRKVMKLLAAAESTDPQNLSANVTRLLNTLKKDEVSFEVWNDSFLLQLAQCLYPMSERKESTVEDIRQRLRQMGRLLLALKKKSICSFEDAIKPQNFSIVVEAVKELTGFNKETKSYDKPGVMKKLGSSLKRIGDINFARAWKEDADTETIREAETFMKLCEEEWGGGPPPNSKGSNLPKSKVKTMPTIPFIHDVQLFYRCLEETAANATQSLTLYECAPVYTALFRVTVAQVAVLNKDMSEVSKVTLRSFQERNETELQEDAAVSQSQLEQILSKHTVKIDLVSDSHQKVGVTLTTKLLTALTLLVNKRDTCGVHKDNPFLFGSPDTPCTSFISGHQCTRIFIGRCGAKNSASIRSAFFHKHIMRFFQILSLTDDELGELAKVLGRNIQTDRGYYQRPEAAVDLAKIFMLLSAMENGSFDRFEGKSFEETEIPDELEASVEPVVEPEVEQNNPEHNDAEEDIEESERFCLLRGIPFTKDPFSLTMMRNHRARKKKQESKEKAPELDDEENIEVNTEKEMAESSAAITPEETMSHSNMDTANISFSDDDEDMNVDFDMDTEEDDVRSEGNNEDTSSVAMPSITDVIKQSNNNDTKESDSSPNKLCSVADLNKTMDMDPVSSVETGGEQDNCMDVDSRGSSGSLNTEKKNKVSAAVTRMKEVKILLSKLDLERVSQLSSGRSSVKSPKKDQPTQDSTNQHLKTPSTTNASDEPNYAKATQMNCSHCKKSMLKGQTAYQKKGYMDVFCSKDCLFQMFPINKPATRTCHYCHKAISQPLDLIMAAVDVKGTMKDFCSPACLISFKSNIVSKPTSQQLCSMCNKTCTTTSELTLNGTVHTFCSDSCQEDFSNAPLCENCSSTCCNKPLNLRLEWATKTVCSQKCLDKFKEKFEMPHPCTLCRTSRQIPDMIDLKSSENMVELFCSHFCVTSYMLCPATREGKKNTEPVKKKSTPSIQIVKAQGGNAASAAADATPVLILADSCVFCCKCGKKLPKGETLHQPKSSLEVFCSAKCLSEKHPHQATKHCYNCFQVIMRPHNVILAPVDDSGTMKELCSNTCLASVNSRRTVAAPKPPPPAAGPLSQCMICSKLCYCKLTLTLDGCIQRICSDTCYTSALRINNLSTCDVCSSISPDKRFMLRAEDGSKIICREECLVKYKQKIDTPRLCPMCQTPHQLSDMVENKNNEGSLDFFCSNRCIMVHKAQLSTVAGRNCPSPEECDIKEMKPLTSPEECDIKEVKPLTSPEEFDVTELKPSLLNFDFIKEEPTDEEYNLPSSTSLESIKAELQAGDDVAKEDLRISSVFSLMEDSATSMSAAATVSHMDLPASCSTCKQILMDRETVYQRKGHADVFCSTPCLLKFYQMKQVKKTCHFCLQGITRPEDVVQAPVDDQDTMKDFCSQTCLSSFNYKKTVSTKIPLAPVVSQSQCSMCSRYCINMHEIIEQDVVSKFCSNPCLLRFCNMNKLSICENCRSHCNTPLILKTEEGSKKLCNSECLAQFKKKIETLQPCAMCRSSCLMSDMLENKNSEDMVELFCTNSCVMASKIQAVSASGSLLDCDHCGQTTLPACHLAMSDASIRNFCTLTCAMAFKESQKDVNAATNSTETTKQTQCDFLKEPEKLPCAQCQRFIIAAPKLIQIKGKVHFVCSLACSQEFNTVNNIIGKCEYCQNERIIRDVQKVDGKDCCFCSDACKRLFQHELEKEWGEHCSLCAYCLSISKMVVTAKYGGNDQEFCSEDCSSNYNLLHRHIAKCDTCGRTGELRQSLPLLGEVKHFCDLRCLLHFCNKKVQMVNTVSSPPRPSGTVDSFPVITNVVSLADALAKYSRARRHVSKVSVPDVQRKVVGHASIQTEPKELKNKSMLCTPLVHNKGVCCSTQTVDKEAQTDDLEPKVNVLPVPVPVYVPLPMNMYCQYTPKPVGLPLPLPVPVFLPEPAVTSVKGKVQPNLLEGDDLSQSERIEEEVGQEQETHTAKGFSEHKDHTSNLNSDSESDLLASVNNQEDSSDTSFGSLSRPHAHKKSPLPAPPPPLEMRSNLQSPDPAAPLSKVHKKNKGRKRRRSGKAATEEKKTTWKHHKLKSQHGVNVWKRWVHWRKTNLALVSTCAVMLKEDILCCSVTELSNSLCCFITEVRRPDGEPYSPSSLFYICLSIQQYLFENGRMENIFSDQVYNKFSTEFTKILRTFKPSITASGYIHSRVEEEFLWDCKQLGAYSPIVLLNTLLFFCCKYFGFTTVEQHRQLSFAHVMRCTKTNQNNTKTTFLRFYPPISINEGESDTNGAPTKKRMKTENMEDVLEMMENTENPLRCPARLYEFYLSKCSESVRQRSDLFYLQPHHGCVPNSPLWFSSTPLDDSTVEAMLVRALTVRELQNQRAFMLKEKRS